MREILRKHHISFKAAFTGVWYAFRSQPNFKVHIFFSAAVLVAAWFFRISRIELIILWFTIVLGMVAEMINTSIESVTDLVTREWRMEAKVAKDVSAGMMLVTALGAVVVAAIIFWPYVFS